MLRAALLGPVGQDEMKRSPVRASVFLSFIGLAVIGLTVLRNGPFSLILCLLAVLPALFIFSSLKFAYYDRMPTALSLEFFGTGVWLSTSLAALLEMMSFVAARPSWKCEQLSNPSLACQASFVLAVVIGIGMAEEFTKALPLWRIYSSVYWKPQSCNVWNRVLTDPLAYMLCGACSGLGFATLENLQYVVRSGDQSTALFTAAARAVLAVPFHVMCTTFAAGVFSESLFKSTMKSRDVTVALLNGAPFPRGDDGLVLQPSISFGALALGFGLPSLLHGLYDSCLFLAESFSHSVEGEPMTITTLLPASLFVFGSFVCYGVAATAMIIQWKRVLKTERFNEPTSAQLAELDVEGSPLPTEEENEAIDTEPTDRSYPITTVRTDLSTIDPLTIDG